MKKLFLLILSFLGTALYSQNQRGFQFIESSSGMNYPTWESGMTELEFADINRDGFVDILSIGDHGCPNIGSQEHGIMVWFGNGTGTWSVQMTGTLGYGGIAIGDVNNDGHWDVGYGMHHNYSSTDLGNQLMEVALGDGTGINWTPWDDGLATNGESYGMFGTDFADVDNDGDLDVGSNSFGSGDGLHVYLNQGNGNWVQSFGFLSGNSNMRFVFGDINNDGNSDFVVTNDAGIAYFGDGTGNFTNADFNLPNYSFPMSGPDLGDVNNDGAQDLAYVNPSGGVMVWVFNTGTNQWDNYSGTLPATGNYQEVQFRDFNNDGVMDLAAFGNAHLTVWSGELKEDQTVIWTQEFTLTTSNNGDCGAFRAGGDVDRNGFPDMTLVEKVGSWPNDKNHLKCFKETTPFSKATITALFPKGNERFKQGSVQFIDWISAVPVSSTSLIKIEYSLQGNQGPWTTIITGTENSGRYQWIIPQTISSNNCFIKYTLVEGIDTIVAYTSESFTILGENGLVADFVADSTTVYPDSQVQFTDQSLGLITSWQWDFDNNGMVDATDRNPSYAYPQSGIYTVKLTVSDGINSQDEIKSDYITVLPSVQLEEQQNNKSNWWVFPNPCKDLLTIHFSNPGPDHVMVEVFDISGSRVCQLLDDDIEQGTDNLTFDIQHIPSGTYCYRIQSIHFVKNGIFIKIE
jgi:PKD repeat protein